MRVLVCGGRNWTDKGAVYRALDTINRVYGIDVVIEGSAQGADRMAGFWARKHRIINIKFHAEWKKHGKQAGRIRNQEMLAVGGPALVVAFPGGKGTAHMVSIAREARVQIFEPMKKSETGRMFNAQEAATGGSGAP